MLGTVQIYIKIFKCFHFKYIQGAILAVTFLSGVQHKGS